MGGIYNKKIDRGGGREGNLEVDNELIGSSEM